MESAAVIRRAVKDDLPALIRIEQRCFVGDRMSRRSLSRLLERPTVSIFVWEDPAGAVGGSVVVVYHRARTFGRIYSIAVDPDFQGRGAGRALLDAAESDALDRGCTAMRSEVRKDNDASLALFRRAGYQPFAEIEDYYGDHMDAIRFQRRLGGDSSE